MQRKMQKKKQVKVELTGKLAEKFKRIKAEYGLKSDAETLRFCITKEHKRLFCKSALNDTDLNTINAE